MLCRGRVEKRSLDGSPSVVETASPYCCLWCIIRQAWVSSRPYINPHPYIPVVVSIEKLTDGPAAGSPVRRAREKSPRCSPQIPVIVLCV